MLRVLGRPQVLCDGVPRRELMRIGGALPVRGVDPAALGGSVSECRREDTRAGPIDHHVQSARRPVAHRHVRPEARRPRRDPRRVPADRHVVAGPPDLRAPAAARAVDAPGDLIRTVQPHVQLAQPAAVHDRLHRRPAASIRPSRPTRRTSARSASTWARPERPARGRVHAVLPRLGAEGLAAARALRRLPRQAVRPALHALQADLRPRAEASSTTTRSCRSASRTCRRSTVAGR